jgi:cytochrome c553
VTAPCRHPQRYRLTIGGAAFCRRCHRYLAKPRPGAGRPPIRGTAQTYRLPSIKCTEAELAEIQAAAGDEPLGPWIVEAALRRARGG